MATHLKLDGETEQLIDSLMATGQFAERADVVRHGIRLAHEEDRLADEPLSAEDEEAIERGLADVAAGRVRPAEDVFDEVLRELRAKL